MPTPSLNEATLARRIDQAMAREPADLVIRNVTLLDLVTGESEVTDIAVCGDTIVGTYRSYEGREEIDGAGLTAVPGFIDTHLHVESSLVTPAEFDRCVLPRGTTTAICDPHEIANVLGADGIRWFLDCAAVTVMDLRVQLSSCVPATDLETSGARLEAADLLAFKGAEHGLGLAEFMNVPGVIHKEPGALAKLAAFADTRKDGHAPLLRGTELNAYLAAGILNDHETTTFEEAREKIRKGMQVLIREGSVSKDLHALAPLIGPETWPFLAFCTDDRNPLDIAEEGHLDHMIRTAIALGGRPLDVYRVATWAAAKAFGLDDRGLVAPGRRADIVLVSDVEACTVETVISAGRVVGPALFGTRPVPEPVGRGSIRLAPVCADAFAVPAGDGPAEMPVIGIIPDRIITEHRRAAVPVRAGHRVADPAQDILKVAVLARHGVNRNIGRGFVQGFGFSGGALASSVGHDAHNVCVVGDDDAAMAAAVNRLIELEGGFVAVAGDRVVAELPLPIAGLMSDRPFEDVEAGLRPLRQAVAAMGCPLAEAFLQLAFLPLPVIPHLKITDMGLVDVDQFALVG